MGLNWLITGGCGFIGTSLIKRLMAEGGNAVRVVDNLSHGSITALKSVAPCIECKNAHEYRLSTDRCQLLVGDITDSALSKEATKDIDIVVHLAANTGVLPSIEDPRLDLEVNIKGTFNYLHSSWENGVSRFVFASSGAPIGLCTPPIHEEMAPHPVSPYGASKLACEGYCSVYYQTFCLDTVVLRFGNVYGPGSAHKESAIAKFIRQGLAGETIEIYGSDNQTRDFLFIDDLTDAVLSAAHSTDIGGQLFQIATGMETTLNELIELMCDSFRRYGLDPPTYIYSDCRKGDVLRNYSNTDKAHRYLNWRA